MVLVAVVGVVVVAVVVLVLAVSTTRKKRSSRNVAEDRSSSPCRLPFTAQTMSVVDRFSWPRFLGRRRHPWVWLYGFRLCTLGP